MEEARYQEVAEKVRGTFERDQGDTTCSPSQACSTSITLQCFFTLADAISLSTGPRPSMHLPQNSLNSFEMAQSQCLQPEVNLFRYFWDIRTCPTEVAMGAFVPCSGRTTRKKKSGMLGGMGPTSHHDTSPEPLQCHQNKS